MVKYIDSGKLCELARNRTTYTANANDIMRGFIEPVKPIVFASWILVADGTGVCSNCNRQDHIDPLARYCRYCGANIGISPKENEK